VAHKKRICGKAALIKLGLTKQQVCAEQLFFFQLKSRFFGPFEWLDPKITKIASCSGCSGGPMFSHHHGFPVGLLLLQ